MEIGVFGFFGLLAIVGAISCTNFGKKFLNFISINLLGVDINTLED